MQSSRTTLYVEAGSRQKLKLTTAATRQGSPRSQASCLPRLRHALFDPHMHEEVGFVKTRVELGRVEVRQGLLFQKRVCLLAGLLPFPLPFPLPLVVTLTLTLALALALFCSHARNC